MDDSTRDLFRDQTEKPKHLIGAYTPLAAWMNCCPRARTLTGWSVTLDSHVIIQVTCKNWGCPICGRRKVQRYAKMVADACPNRLITLTVNPGRWENPRAAYDGTRRAVPRLTAKLRKAYGEFEFFRILEVTKKGWPHYHLVTRSPFIPQGEISNLWDELTGAPIVDVRELKKKTNAYWYVVKYLGKQEYIPWTDRRASSTKGFFVKTEFVAGPGLELQGQRFVGHRPDHFLGWDHRGWTLERYSTDCWRLIAPAGQAKSGPWWDSQAG